MTALIASGRGDILLLGMLAEGQKITTPIAINPYLTDDAMISFGVISGDDRVNLIVHSVERGINSHRCPSWHEREAYTAALMFAAQAETHRLVETWQAPHLEHDDDDE